MKQYLLISIFLISSLIQSSQIHEEIKWFAGIRPAEINPQMYRVRMKCQVAPNEAFRENLEFRKNHKNVICAFMGATYQELCSLPNFQFNDYDIVARWYLTDRMLELEISGSPIIKIAEKPVACLKNLLC